MDSSHLLDKKSIATFAAFVLFGGAVMAVFRLVPASQGHSFEFGGYTLQAVSYRGNGLYHDVTMKERSWFAGATRTKTQAKSALFDPHKPGHLVLNNGTTATYDENGALQSRVVFSRMVMDKK